MRRDWKFFKRQPRNTRESEPASEEFSNPETAELERLYQQALSAMEALDVGLQAASGALEASKRPETRGDGASDSLEAPGPANGAILQFAGGDASPQPHSPEGAVTPDGKRRPCPRQIIEAALFVGGAPLTAKKLASLLRDEFDQQFIEEAIDTLNAQYAVEERPYEVRLGEGGYCLSLRSSFERVRGRVFGVGPKEIKLSQEALEVLALVAYQQPVSRDSIENVRQTPSGSVLRYLLRRELIAIDRTPQTPDSASNWQESESASSAGSASETVWYRTTDRFLEAFGLVRLDDLPQAEDLNLK
jgi:segregation and condensation protein B